LAGWTWLGWGRASAGRSETGGGVRRGVFNGSFNGSARAALRDGGHVTGGETRQLGPVGVGGHVTGGGTCQLGAGRCAGGL